MSNSISSNHDRETETSLVRSDYDRHWISDWNGHLQNLERRGAGGFNSFHLFRGMDRWRSGCLMWGADLCGDRIALPGDWRLLQNLFPRLTSCHSFCVELQ